jgi:hypothetical protein
MSYRRFLALLSGLSPESIFFARLNQVEEDKKNAPIEGAENIAQHMAAMLSA